MAVLVVVRGQGNEERRRRLDQVGDDLLQGAGDFELLGSHQLVEISNCHCQAIPERCFRRSLQHLAEGGCQSQGAWRLLLPGAEADVCKDEKL